MAVTGSPVEIGSVAGRTGGSGVTVLPSSDYRYVSFTCCTLGTSITRVHCCASVTASCFLVRRRRPLVRKFSVMCGILQIGHYLLYILTSRHQNRQSQHCKEIGPGKPPGVHLATGVPLLLNGSTTSCSTDSTSLVYD